MRDGTGRVVLTSGVASDITARKETEEAIRLYAKAFQSIADGVIVTDAEQRIVSVNQAFTTITGYAEAEIVGKTPRFLQSGRHDAAFYRAIWEQIQRDGHWRGEIWDRRKNGEVYPELLSISAVRDASEATTHYVGVCTEISSLKEYEARLHHQAHHDALTGLPNRVLYQSRLREALSRARRHGRQVAVMLLDLDHFKTINDSLGTPPATASWRASARGSVPAFARPIRSRGLAATSSPCCWTVCRTTRARPRPRAPCSTPWPRHTRSRARNSR